MTALCLGIERWFEKVALWICRHRLVTILGMLVTTIVLSTGFFICAFATMRNIINFGMLTGLTIVMALAADCFAAPALMVTVNRVRHPATGGKNDLLQKN
jgi:hypothetical protein